MDRLSENLEKMTYREAKRVAATLRQKEEEKREAMLKDSPPSLSWERCSMHFIPLAPDYAGKIIDNSMQLSTLLDRELIDYTTRIPPQLLVKNAQEKYILRQVAQSYLPAAILQREKFGFVAPGSPYLIRQKIDWVNDALSYETNRRQGYFNPDTIERLKKRFSREGENVNTTFETDFLMIVLTFGILLETFNLPDYS